MCIPKFENREASAVVQVIYGQALRMPNFEKECAKQSKIWHQWISEAAYYKVEARAFAAGRELNDWLAAEKDYTEMLITAYLSVFEEDGGMTKANLQQLAKVIGVEIPEGISNKTELMRTIQLQAKQRPCFRSDNYMSCEDKDCKWRTECKKLVAVWMR